MITLKNWVKKKNWVNENLKLQRKKKKAIKPKKSNWAKLNINFKEHCNFQGPKQLKKNESTRNIFSFFVTWNTKEAKPPFDQA